jgi:transposase
VEIMGEITTVGLDFAKSVFQVHAVDAEGRVAIRRQVRRPQLVKFFAGLPPCLIGMEACATAHYWARELTALGHEVKLMPPAYVKPYVKRQKNDAADAEAICEAVTRPTMRFVPVKLTNGYRAMWAAEGEADIRTVVDTARLGPEPMRSTQSFRLCPPEPQCEIGRG